MTARELPVPGDVVLWRWRTTIVRVDYVNGDLVYTRGRPGVSAVADHRSKIRFWIRRTA